MGKYAFGIPDEFLDILEKEFSIKAVVGKYEEDAKGKVNKGDIAQKVFGDYGRNLADRIIELEGNFRDNTAKVIYEVAAKTGHVFPSVPQRLLEIGFNALRPFDEWKYREVSHKSLVIEVKDCTINKGLKEEIGEGEAKQIPCRSLCLGFSDELFKKLGLKVELSMTKSRPVEGCCCFRADLQGK